jgi:copper resistance protein C
MRATWLIGGTVALALFAGAAAAHAFLEQADPRVGSTVRSVPLEVTLRFSQDIEPAFSSATITDASGQRVDTGAPDVHGNVMRVPLRAIDVGSYRVTWHVLSVDTHTTEGAFTFAVEQAMSKP